MTIPSENTDKNIENLGINELMKLNERKKLSSS